MSTAYHADGTKTRSRPKLPPPTPQVTRTNYEVWYIGNNGIWSWACTRGTIDLARERAQVYIDKGTRAIIAEATRRPVFDSHPD